jgi:glycosyltransferase involved in cell wall biosynthesis
MKRVVMWMGMGNNEPGWAKIISTASNVFMVRCGLVQQISVWENGQCTWLVLGKPAGRWLLIDRVFFGFFSACRLTWLTWKHTRQQPVAFMVVEGPRGFLALWLKWLGKVQALVSLHSDFLPPTGKWPVRLHRCLNMALNRFIARHADEVWRISPRIPIGDGHARNFVVPIYIDDNRIPLLERRGIVYLGVPSEDHALDVLFEIARRHNIPLHIIGASPYLDSIKSSAPADTTFHGYLTDPARIAEIVKHCFCGYAVYRNTSPQNYSYYGVPSKSFHYLANNVPVVTTDTAHFSQIVENHHVGRVVSPEPEQIEAAILQMREHSRAFYDAVNRFRIEWNRGVEDFLAGRMKVLMS